MGFNTDDARKQAAMCRAADQAYLDRCKHFAEVQASGNPLSKAEVARLIEKRPALWSFAKGLGV